MKRNLHIREQDREGIFRAFYRHGGEASAISKRENETIPFRRLRVKPAMTVKAKVLYSRIVWF